MSSKKKGTQGEDIKQEDILQAVVIADSFNVRFAPITHEKPRTLLPLANIPLLDYTLELLFTSGIQEVIIFCCNHADQIRKHIQNSKWSRENSPCEITVLSSERCLSMGDALRDIDAKSLLKSDFVLVNGDIVSNMNLKNAIMEHKQRRQKLKTPVMTMVMKKALPGHRTRCPEEEVIVAVGREDDRIVLFHKVVNDPRFSFPLELLLEHKDLDLRYDLLDCNISICSPLVSTLFTDNFDYETRDDFIRGILVNEEIMGNTVHIKVVEDDYAARVSNLLMYDSVSRDVLARWTYPLVPDSNITGESSHKHSYGRHNIYLHKDVTLARGCVLHKNVVIGKGSSIGSNTWISNSVIGKNCKIGEDVHLDGAYVWDNTTIENKCRIKTSVLDEGVYIYEGTSIQPGCVLAANVKVGPNVSLPRDTLLMSKIQHDDSFEDDEDKMEPEEFELGDKGFGYLYTDEDNMDINMLGMIIGSDEEGPSSEEEEMDSGDEGMGSPIPEEDDTKLFYDEVIGTLQRALEENIHAENLILEINSLKHAYNIQIKEVNVFVAKALVEYPLHKNPDMELVKYFTSVKSVLKTFMPLLRNYYKSAESQKDCLDSIESVCLTQPVVASALMKMLHFLYEADVLAEAVIVRWHRTVTPGSTEETERREIRKNVNTFITWLQEAEEESDSDEDSD